jgi:hypothetical protein
MVEICGQRETTACPGSITEESHRGGCQHMLSFTKFIEEKTQSMRRPDIAFTIITILSRKHCQCTAMFQFLQVFEKQPLDNRIEEWANASQIRLIAAFRVVAQTQIVLSGFEMEEKGVILSGQNWIR